MTVNLKKNMKKTSVFKKRPNKKTRSVQSLIAKNKKVLDKLKESSDDSEDVSDIEQSETESFNSEEVPSTSKQTKSKGKHESSEDDDDGGDDDMSEDDDYGGDDDMSEDDNDGGNGDLSEDDNVEENDDDDMSEDDEVEKGDLLDDKQHKKSLAKLKDTDPEFYKFLKENDKNLLEFQASDSDGESEAGSDDGEKVHKPPEQLEVDSDEDDFAEGDAWAGGSGTLITLAMVKEWQKQLQEQPSVQLVTETVKAFQAALQTVSGEEESAQNEYRVDGSSVFNAVIQLCVLELQPALVKLLNLRSNSLSKSDPSKSKRWNKVKHTLKNYITGLLKLLSAVTSANILTVLLKHLHQMTSFLGFYHTLVRSAVKQLISLWSNAQEETVRVVAFLCILRLTTNQQKSLLDSVLKMMYVAYISNSKFMSTSTLPNVTFMRRSLAEMFCLDATVSYQHAFLYIRQLAIHLRNAITVHKKESIQAVCNWQYMNSLRLWVDLICSTNDKSPLRALLYPLTQVTIGCIKLVPTAQYVPLRFHCCQLLTKLSQDTNTYIPVLPFIAEALTLTDFNKKYKKMSIKPMDLTCVLRVNKSGLGENGFRDAIVEQVYQLLLEYCNGESHRICFPDIIVPAAIQLRSFVKDCKVGKFSQKIRQALAKVEESGRFIEGERRKVTLNLNDSKAVEAWETNIRTQGTPLSTFYQSWKKVHQRQMAKQATQNDKLGDFKIPLIKKSVKKQEEPSSSGPVELFPSDSDSDNLGFEDEEETTKIKKQKKTKKDLKQKKTVQNVTNEEDIKEESDSDSMEDVVEELRLSDLE